MCDAQVRADSMWPRWYDCGRKGKHDVIGEVVTYGKGTTGTRIVANLCGQHKNILEKGDTLTVNHFGKDVSIRGEVTEIGKLQKETEKAKDELRTAQWSLDNRKQNLGLVAGAVSDKLMELLENTGDKELLWFKETLESYRRQLDVSKAAQHRINELESEIEKLKEG